MASMGVRNFRRFFVAQSLSSVGTWFRTLALALLAVGLAESGSVLGAVVALQWLPLLLLGTHVGAMLDRRDARTVLVVTNLVSAGIAAGVTALSATGSLDGWWLAGASLAFGFVLPFDRPTVQVLPVELVPRELVSNALALGTMIQSLARLVGPAIAGVALAELGPTWCFAVNVVTYLVSALLLSRLDARTMHPRPRTTASPRGQVRAGLTYAARHPELRTVLAVNAFIGLLALNFLVVVTAIVELGFAGGERAAGFAHAANAAGALVGGALVGARLPALSRRLDLVCLALGAALAVNALAPTLPLFLALGPLLGLTYVAYQSSVLDACHRLAEPHMFGRMASLVTIGAMGTTPIGSLIVGVVIDVWSARGALGVGAVSCVVGAAALALVRRRQPHEPHPPDTTAAAAAPDPVS